MNLIEYSLYVIIVGVLFLTVVLFFLYSQYHEKSMLYWAVNGILTTVCFIILLYSNEDFSRGVVNPDYLLTSLSTTIFSLQGLALYTKKKMRRTWIVAMILCAIWTLIGLSLPVENMFVYIPGSVYLTVAYAYTGIGFLRVRTIKRVGNYISGICFLLYATQAFEYPFLSTSVSFIPVGVFILNVITLALVVGILLVYFENLVTKLRENEISLVNAKNSAEIANQAKDQFLANMSDALLLVGPDGKITGLNRAADILFEYDETQLLGIPIELLLEQGSLKDDVLSIKWKELVLRSEIIQDHEVDVLSNSGKKIPTALTKTRLIDSYGKLQAYIYIFADQTDKKQAEENRHLLEKLTETDNLKDNIITWAAHELKTPLTPILAIAELLVKSKQMELRTPMRFDMEDLEILLRNAERLLKIVENFLDVGRLQHGTFPLNLAVTDIDPLIQDAIKIVELQASRKHIRFDVRTSSLQLKIDRERIEQVIINILANAIKYSPENSTVDIKIDQAEENEKKFALLTVHDQGFGFTKEELQNAFLPFAKVYTLQEQKKFLSGTGLGLFISKSLVEAHGGKIQIQSEGVNQGTTVKVFLPLEN